MPKPVTGRPVGRPAKPRNAAVPGVNSSRAGLPRVGDSGAVETPPVPAGIGAAGGELWCRLWSAGREWLSPAADAVLLEMLCHAADEHDTIRAELESGRVPRFYTLANGSHATHPLVSQLKDLRVQMTSWLAALGFSPADRLRLGIGAGSSSGLTELERRRAERASVKPV